MKKVILMTACIAAMLLSGCSDNELASVGDGIGTSTQSAIGFHVVGNQAETRATPITPDNITTTDFNVFAFTRNKTDGSDGNFFMGEKEYELGESGIMINGIKITNKNKNWDYANASDIHYWPEESTALNFYAVNPAKTAENIIPNYSWSITKDTKTISYLCNDEYGVGPVNYDVMYGIAPNQTKSENNGIVKFQFKHILSQVMFKAKTQLANMDVEIKEMKIYNFKMSGTYTLPTATSTTAGKWDLPNITPQKVPFTVVKNKAIKVTNAGKDISVDAPMLFVPQTLKAWQTDATTAKTKEDADKAGESYLEITCKIKQNGVYVFGSETEYKTLYVPFGTTWEQGKRYIYTLIFGGGYDENGKPILQPINFEAEAEDWTEATGNSNNDNNVNL